MTIEFVVLHDVGVLWCNGWDITREVLAAETRALMIAWGHSEWEVDDAMTRVRYDHATWSDSYNGFVHDCAGHLPEETDPAQCFPDARPVSVVLGLPPSWFDNPPGASPVD